MIIQLKSKNIRLLIKVREVVEILKNVKNIKNLISCFDNNAYILITLYNVVIYNVRVVEYEFSKNNIALTLQIVKNSAYLIFETQIRYIK